MNLRTLSRSFLLLPVLAMCAPAFAQEPAVLTSPSAESPRPKVQPEETPADMPALDPAMPAGGPTGLPPSSAQQPMVKGPGEGTTIVGERESPIGLYITPWKSSFAEKELDRPARLMQEQLLPLDRYVFLREVEYYEALGAALRKKNQVSPEVSKTK